MRLKAENACANSNLVFRNNARYMKKTLRLLATLITLATANLAQASIIQYFKEEDGSTNWQYIANFSSSVLILLLLISTICLFIIARKAYRANKELEAIKENLEKLVQERTELLEGEVVQHKETTALLQSSEAYIKSILDSMPLMLIGLNKELQVTQWNNYAEQSSGFKIDDVLGKYLWDAYPTITVSPDKVKEVLDKGESTSIKLSQRGQYYLDITLYPLVDHPETGIVIMVDDVTQQSKAANILIQKDKFSAMGELASAMAHDISIPLGALETTIDHIKTGLETSEPDKSKLLQMLDEGRADSQQASAIINHLIGFANSDGEKKLASVPDILDHALDIARNMFFDTGGLKFSDISVTKTYADELHLVPCHVAEIQQVCLSILRHACYALGKASSEDHKPLINMDVSEFYDSVWIKIQHNGAGLSGEEQMTIFEPFYQNEDIDDGCEMENRLSFPHFIVTEHHGGQMAVTSDLEVGTTFHIQLRLK